MFDTYRHRRQFLRDAGLAALPLLAGGRLFAEKPNADGLIPRQTNPDNLEFPFASLDSFLTPNKLFYVRSHFAVPDIAEKDWSLDVVGAVGKPQKFTLEQVRKMPAKKMPITLECAGNGRSFLVPPAKGVLWATGAVSTAEWEGVTLKALLDAAGGVTDGALEVILEGTDEGEPGNELRPIGKIPFARSLPLKKALSPEVLLAYDMGGEALSRPHGFPLRTVVGGWYGMASVKWLRRVIVTTTPFHGYWQSIDYSVWKTHDGLRSLDPITACEVKASIARPTANETLPAGKDVRVRGAAWAGENAVARVEVSTDGGKTWAEARLDDKTAPFCWRLWEYTWKAPAAGAYELLVRATDSKGRKQDVVRDPERRNYVITHSVKTPVTVK